jgi:multiple sugar transport system substrate-binding protein
MSATVLALAMAIFAAGCGGGNDANSDAAGNKGASNSASANQSGRGNAAGGRAEGQTPDKPYAGTKLTVYLANHPWTSTIEPYLPEFEEQTGIDLDVQSFYEEQFTQKLTVQLTSGASDPDVYMNRLMVTGRLYYENGWVAPLNEFIDNAPAEYDFADFTESSISAGTYNGDITAIPVNSEQQVLYYRKDILEANNVPVPKTMQELYDAAVKLQDPANQLYGFMTMTTQSSIVTQASSFVYSEGGDFITDGKATVNTPETLAGLKVFADLLKDAGPPEKLNMAWPQALDMFAQGNIVFFTHANSIHDGATNPEKSKVADKIGFAPMPAGAKGSVPYNITPWALSINAKSENKAAAWEFIQWATSKENVLRTQMNGTPGSRKSVWENPEGTSGFPADLAETFKTEGQRGVDHNGPNNIFVVEARDIIGELIVRGIVGEDMAAHADATNQALQELLEKEAKQFNP